MTERDRLREDRDLDWADAKAARDELDATESLAAEASHWSGVFKQMPPYVAQTVYASGPG